MLVIMTNEKVEKTLHRFSLKPSTIDLFRLHEKEKINVRSNDTVK